VSFSEDRCRGDSLARDVPALCWGEEEWVAALLIDDQLFHGLLRGIGLTARRRSTGEITANNANNEYVTATRKRKAARASSIVEKHAGHGWPEYAKPARPGPRPRKPKRPVPARPVRTWRWPDAVREQVFELRRRRVKIVDVEAATGVPANTIRMWLRDAGVTIGHAPGSPVREEAVRLAAAGVSYREIGRRVGVYYGTVRRWAIGAGVRS
jgi:hypothetical protein